MIWPLFKKKKADENSVADGDTIEGIVVEEVGSDTLLVEKPSSNQKEVSEDSGTNDDIVGNEVAVLEAEPQQRSWLGRMRDGLHRSGSKVGGGIAAIFTNRRLDDEALEELEDLLITSDLGVSVSAKIIADLSKERFGKEVSPEEVKEALSNLVAASLEPVAQPLVIDDKTKPHVVLMVGVNGAGKTTTIGKLAQQFKAEGKSVMMAAGDTFRAAAIEQLKVWGERVGSEVISRNQGSDPAGLAFDALAQARKSDTDVLLFDTAGRLHNKTELMAELQKIIRVIKKQDETAPHDIVLVLDATTGQNAVNQVATFRELVEITGLIVTKLDGSARGGVVVGLAEKFGLPVHAIGVGETADDMQPFEPKIFADALVGRE